MEKKIKSTVISIGVVLALLIAVIIGSKNGTFEKLKNNMPTVPSEQENRSDKISSENNNSNQSISAENEKKAQKADTQKMIVNQGESFEVRVKGPKEYKEDDRSTYNVFHVTVKSSKISPNCDFDINRIHYGLSKRKEYLDSNNNFTSTYEYLTVELEITYDEDNNDYESSECNMFQSVWNLKKKNDELWISTNGSGTVGDDVTESHGHTYFEKGETKAMTLYWFVTEEEASKDTLVIDFGTLNSNYVGPFAIVHKSEE